MHMYHMISHEAISVRVPIPHNLPICSDEKAVSVDKVIDERDKARLQISVCGRTLTILVVIKAYHLRTISLRRRRRRRRRRKRRREGEEKRRGEGK